MVALRRSNRLHYHSGSTDEAGKRMERKERQTSIMLIVIVLIFMACNTLAFVVNILENVEYQASDEENAKTFTLLVMYTNFVVSLCSISKFFNQNLLR